MSADNVMPRPGALRYKGEDGVWHWANPHDLYYSTVTMNATEYWKDGSWVKICEEEQK